MLFEEYKQVTFYLQKTRRWKKFENTTAHEWLRKWAGQRPYEVIWEPMLRGKFGRHYDEVSMAWLWGGAPKSLCQ